MAALYGEVAEESYKSFDETEWAKEALKKSFGEAETLEKLKEKYSNIFAWALGKQKGLPISAISEEDLREIFAEAFRNVLARIESGEWKLKKEFQHLAVEIKKLRKEGLL